ncbi:hypothetical protein [Maridesulfovibrio bastinii]|uniref:hypothetical protein n=1 Tax=Maridesulfovibrio bastinii TaxID=47157 RepID=UPI0004190512|nr:hypothetical protein [Maridesulfovibrio bastinii]
MGKNFTKTTLLIVILIFGLSSVCSGAAKEGLDNGEGKPTIVFALIPRIKNDKLSQQECNNLVRNLNKSLQQEFNEAGFITHRDRIILGFSIDACKRSYATQNQSVAEDEIISIARDDGIDYVVIGLSEISISYDEDYDEYSAMVDINGDFLGINQNPPVSYAMNLTGEYSHPNKENLIKLSVVDISRKLARLRTIKTILKNWKTPK